MKKTIDWGDFNAAFIRMNRENNFSYEGRKALFDYLEEFEKETGEEIEMDVIALCCDYSEYANIKEFQKDYGEDYEHMDDIRDNTTVIDIDGEAFIIQNF